MFCVLVKPSAVSADLEEVFCCLSQRRNVSQEALPQALRNAVDFWFCYGKRIYGALLLNIPAL